MALSPSLNERFGALPDPRLNRTKRHKLIDILVLAICAMVCGAEDFVAMARFG
ncbi:MAG: transposase family protein, partial [Chthonomonadales bacterium]|nr:transposase family protein [Chthonomonadales bacterium]